MPREIILPPHLYDRIKASAGEHGGIGKGRYFSDDSDIGPGTAGMPLCAHGHAWGTCTRFQNNVHNHNLFVEPELNKYITIADNDDALYTERLATGQRVPFARWCELLNVKRGPEVLASPVSVVPELVSVA